MIPVLPRGVVVHENALEDRALQQSYPLNATALRFLSLIDGRRTLSSISAELALHYQQSEEAISQDILPLSRQLHQHGLLNLKESWRQFCLRWMIGLRTFTLPPLYSWRSDAPSTTNILVLFFWTCLVVFRAWLLPFVGSLVCLLFLGIALGVFWPLAGWYAFIWICLILSISLHEASHLIILRLQLSYKGGFFVHTGPFLHLTRPPLGSVRAEMLTSLSGPLVPTLIALLVLIWHFFHGTVFDWIVIAFFGVHVLQLILPNRDLSNVFRMVRLARR